MICYITAIVTWCDFENVVQGCVSVMRVHMCIL